MFIACSCDPNGSINQTCDAITGQCYCKANVVGRTCNQCDLQYYGLSTGAGCKPCNCPPLYSTSSQCSDDGQCQCKTGVGSAKCTTCAAGYYDLTVTGMIYNLYFTRKFFFSCVCSYISVIMLFSIFLKVVRNVLVMLLVHLRISVTPPLVLAHVKVL